VAPDTEKKDKEQATAPTFTVKLHVVLERFMASHLAFPALLVLWGIDFALNTQGILFLIGILGVAGFCAEEYIALLRRRGLKAPLALGFYAALIPVLLVFFYRPMTWVKLFAGDATLPYQPNILPLTLGPMTAATLGLILCVLMVALALISEVTERFTQGLGVFCLACAGSLVIGAIFAHAILARQGTLGLALPWAWLPREAAQIPQAIRIWPTVGLLVAGWLWAIVTGFIAPRDSKMRLSYRFTGLGIMAVALFWAYHPYLL
jgi:hypothetical protein